MGETLVFKPGRQGYSVVSERPCATVHQDRKTGHGDVEYYGGYLVAESVPPELVPLLTAAPDLLEACKALVKSLPPDEIELAREAWGNTNTRIVLEALAAAQAAIAKAEGRA